MNLKDINLNDYEEITCREFEDETGHRSGEGNHIRIMLPKKLDTCISYSYIYLRKKVKFPIIFEDITNFKIEVYEDGSIKINSSNKEDSIYVKSSIPLLEQAIEKAKELRK